MKRVKLHIAHKIVYIQAFDLLEHSNWNLFEFQLQFNWSLRSSKGNFINFLNKALLFSGEGKDVTGEMTDPWKETTLQTILSNYAKTDICNADELGLLFKALPKENLHLKDDKCTGGKHSKIRVTGLAAVRMNSDKLPMFVIGKSKKTRCFKNVKKLPCRYRGQNKSWVDSTLFENWVRELDNQLEKENRKVALIIDNCTAHPDIGGLKAIDLFLLPPNTTSALQPMDQGVIRSLKARYRTKVVQKMIEAIDNKNSLPTISLLDAIKMLVLAWYEVTDKTVQNCFKKSGFSETEDNDAVSDYPFAALKDSITHLSILEKIFEDVTVEDVAYFDDMLVPTQDALSEEDILPGLLAVDIDDQHESDEDDSQSEVSEVLLKPNPSQVRAAIDTLMKYSMIIGTAELQGLTVKASRLVELEITTCKTKEDDRLLF